MPGMCEAPDPIMLLYKYPLSPTGNCPPATRCVLLSMERAQWTGYSCACQVPK